MRTDNFHAVVINIGRTDGPIKEMGKIELAHLSDMQCRQYRRILVGSRHTVVVLGTCPGGKARRCPMRPATAFPPNASLDGMSYLGH